MKQRFFVGANVSDCCARFAYGWSACWLCLLFALSGLLPIREADAAHAIAQYGQPKYAPGFAHFVYVNPDAPKRGTLTLANPNRRTSFDKFNPFTLRGNEAPGIGLLFETLLIASADEVASAYGLLADEIQVAPDGKSVVFHIHPQARFSNGDPVTAHEVKYSYEMLVSQAAAPVYRVIYADIAGVTVLDRLTLRFDFKRSAPELPLLAGGVPVFSPKWVERQDKSAVPSQAPQSAGLRRKDAKQPLPFDQLTFEIPVSSGPYLIDHYDNGRSITYRRNPAYWGADLPVRRGMYNFERIVYKLYGDDTARLEAFKAGEFDALVEYRARHWVRSYVGKRFKRGELIKGEFKQHNGAAMQGFFINTRRPFFADKRVREALGLAFDFEWANRQLFYQQYERTHSYFANSELAAPKFPDDAELKLLNPLKAQLDASVWGPLPQPSATTAPDSLRSNLRRARELLAQAGWIYRDGALRNAQGEPLRFEILDDSGGNIAQISSAYARNLEKLGIEVKFRTLDFALYQKRLENFDFDLTTLVLPAGQSPGIETLERFGSQAAKTLGSSNISGIQTAAVDSLLNTLLAARTRAALKTATHALDRVLLHGYYVVPHWYTSKHRIAYRETLAHPAELPLYYSAEDWMVSQWWEQKPAAWRADPPRQAKPSKVAGQALPSFSSLAVEH